MEAIQSRVAPYRSQFHLERLLETEDDEFIRQCLSGTTEQLPTLVQLKKDLMKYTDAAKNELNSMIDCNQDLFINIPKSLYEIDGEVNRLQLGLSQTACTLNLNSQQIFHVHSKVQEKLDEIHQLDSEEQELNQQIAILNGIAEIRTKLASVRKYLQSPTRRFYFMAVFRRLADLISSCKANAQDFVPEYMTALEEEVFHCIQMNSVKGMKCMVYCFRAMGEEAKLSQLLFTGLTYPAIGEIYEGIGQIHPFPFEKFYQEFQQNEKISFLLQIDDALCIEALFTGLTEALSAVIASVSPTADYTVFFANYMATKAFLDEFGVSPSGPQYQQFIDLWSLSEYHNLICQKVADLLKPVFGQPTLEVFNRLDVGKVVWKAIEFIWDEGVYIQKLAPQTTKLTIEIIAKYSSMISSGSDSVPQGLLKNVIGSTQFLLGCVAKRVGGQLDVGIQARLRASLSEKLRTVLHPCEQLLVEAIVTACAQSIEALRTVISSYRMTNKPEPSAPSTYVPSFVKPITQASNATTELMQTIISRVLEAYHETLTSLLEKINTEEEKFSKYRKDSGMSDRDKMIHQLQIDTNEFFKLIGAKYSSYNTMPIVYSIKGELGIES